MTDLRIGQAPVLVVGRVNPDLRVTQTPVLSLAVVNPRYLVTQAPVLIVASVNPPYRVTQVPVLILAAASPCGTQWCQIWTITRTDGVIFYFTSLDRDFLFDSITFKSCGSLDPSASQAVSEADAASTMDLSGAISPDGISEHDLYAGLFDGAWVEAWLVPWAGEGGRRLLIEGTWGDLELTTTGFKVETEGDGAKLMQTPLTRPIAPICRFRFGDPTTCQKDLGPLTVTGVVDSAVGIRNFTDAARAEATGYFARGRVTFTSGPNDGVSAEIKKHTAGGVFELWPRLPYPMEAGDEYSMTPGCTNMKDSANGTNGCVAWDNYVNNGGFDWVPTKDKATASADVKDPG